MKMRFVKDGYPLIYGPLLVFGLGAWGCFKMDWALAGHVCAWIGILLALFMLYFFRDPERVSTAGSGELLAGADGLIRAVEKVREERYLKTECWRISVFLNPFNVHVNRSPMAGQVKGLAYTPGRHVLTMQNSASEVNEHSSIYIEGEKTRCLVKQIVGPVVRRVVYWLDMDQTIGRGDRIGMMKFGSRLDMYFPSQDVKILVKKGDRVKAGLTVVAALTKE